MEIWLNFNPSGHNPNLNSNREALISVTNCGFYISAKEGLPKSLISAKTKALHFPFHCYCHCVAVLMQLSGLDMILMTYFWAKINLSVEDQTQRMCNDLSPYSICPLTSNRQLCHLAILASYESHGYLLKAYDEPVWRSRNKTKQLLCWY